MKMYEVTRMAPDEESDGVIELDREEVPMHRPGGFTVMILNDDKTPVEVVVEAVMYGTGLSPEEAMRRVEQAHNGGWAAVASYGSEDLAETVAEKIMRHARQNTRYDRYRSHPHFRNFNGPWPLSAEVMAAGD